MDDINSTKQILKKINLDSLESQIKSFSFNLQNSRINPVVVEKERRIKELESKVLELEHKNVSLEYYKQSIVSESEHERASNSKLLRYVD